MESNLGKWVSEIRDHIREHPKRAPLYFVFTLYLTVWYAITSHYPIDETSTKTTGICSSSSTFVK